MNRIIFGLLLLSLALNAWQGWGAHELARITARQHDALAASNQRWDGLQTAKVRMVRQVKTGDIYIQVPYRKSPFLFPKVCKREMAL